jgi:Tol biopolymer transport system component
LRTDIKVSIPKLLATPAHISIENQYIYPVCKTPTIIKQVFKNILWICCWILPLCAHAQFYTGSQQEFGKSRVQYGEFDWRSQAFVRFKIHYYRGEEDYVEYVAKAYQQELESLEAEFQYSLQVPAELVVFKSLADLRQSNLGISRDAENVGGKSQIYGSKLFIYYEGTHEQLHIQIRRVLAEYLLNTLLYGEKWSDLLLADPLSNHPAWFIQGFASYYSRPWDAGMDAQLKDAFLTGRLDDFSKLSEPDATLAGHAFWNYIYQMYGNDKMFRILKTTYISQHVDRSLLYEIGRTSKELLPEFGNYYKKIYFNDLAAQQDISCRKIPVRTKKKRIYTQFTASPDGTQLALVEFIEGRYGIWLYDTQSLDKQRVSKGGIRLQRIQDYSNPVLGWHPQGKALAYFREVKGALTLTIYSLEDRDKTEHVLAELQKVLSFQYAPDGKHLVVSGVKNGQTDLYLYSLSGNSLEKLTDDVWDDLSPQYTADGKSVIFSSNRVSDTLPRKNNIAVTHTKFDIFKFNLRQKDKLIRVLERITNTPDQNEWKPQCVTPLSYVYLSDRTGTVNLYRTQIDSSILFIDTAVHYTYFPQTELLTNYSTSILDYNTAGGQYYFQVFQNNAYKFYALPEKAVAVEMPEQTYFRRKFMQQEKVLVPVPDTLTESPGDTLPPPITYRKPTEKLYKINFSKDFLLMQVTNSYLNAAYQRYSGPGSVYFNSGINLLFRAAFSDLFEDYRIQGGMRIPMNFNTGEFLGLFDFNRKRTDHQLMLYRQGYLDQNQETDQLVKWTIHEVRYRMSYPFNEIFSLRNTFSYRNDKQLFLARDKASLQKATQHYNQFGFKAELVLDNSLKLEINTWKGWKAKVFAEFGLIPSTPVGSLVNVGWDFRNSQRFYKNIIWVNRFAGAASLGSRPIVYYLGGVDNWSIRPDVDFDPNQPVDPKKDYYFQTIATPMRGFIQNARNGNSFFVLNSELRVPLFNVIADHPLKSEVLRTFQWVIFGDLGCAWTGLTPYSADNHFNTLTIDNKPLEIQLINSREPILGGFGTGIRSKIFGYFVRLDLGWGVENMQIKKKPVPYFSLGYDL